MEVPSFHSEVAAAPAKALKAVTAAAQAVRKACQAVTPMTNRSPPCVSVSQPRKHLRRRRDKYSHLIRLYRPFNLSIYACPNASFPLMYMYGDESTRSPLILVGIALKSGGPGKLLPDTAVAEVSRENAPKLWLYSIYSLTLFISLI